MKPNKTGLGIALAWPDTYCKQAGAWYDPIMEAIGFNQKGFYQVGHAALILIHPLWEEALYFDFGRYHALQSEGRVRSKVTDPDLRIHNKPEFNEIGILQNLENLLEELSTNPSTHGDGALKAGIFSLDAEASLKKCLQLQKQSSITYAPIARMATNCCRFVRTALLAGKPKGFDKFLLAFPYSFVASPMSNVRAAKWKVQIKSAAIHSSRPLTIGTLPPPAIPKHLLQFVNQLHWLAGEGAGSWFLLEPNADRHVLVTRFCPLGKKEFEGIFNWKKNLTNFKMGYPSHFQKITIISNKTTLSLDRLDINIPLLPNRISNQQRESNIHNEHLTIFNHEAKYISKSTQSR